MNTRTQPSLAASSPENTNAPHRDGWQVEGLHHLPLLPHPHTPVLNTGNPGKLNIKCYFHFFILLSPVNGEKKTSPSPSPAPNQIKLKPSTLNFGQTLKSYGPTSPPQLQSMKEGSNKNKFHVHQCNVKRRTILRFDLHLCFGTVSVIFLS